MEKDILDIGSFIFYKEKSELSAITLALFKEKQIQEAFTIFFFTYCDKNGAEKTIEFNNSNDAIFMLNTQKVQLKYVHLESEYHTVDYEMFHDSYLSLDFYDFPKEIYDRNLVTRKLRSEKKRLYTRIMRALLLAQPSYFGYMTNEHDASDKFFAPSMVSDKIYSMLQQKKFTEFEEFISKDQRSVYILAVPNHYPHNYLQLVKKLSATFPLLYNTPGVMFYENEQQKASMFW